MSAWEIYDQGRERVTSTAAFGGFQIAGFEGVGIFSVCQVVRSIC